MNVLLKYTFGAIAFIAFSGIFSSCASKTTAIHSLVDAKEMEDVQTQVKVLENRLDHVMNEINVMRDRMETMIIKAQQQDYALPSDQEVNQRVMLKQKEQVAVEEDNFLGVGTLKEDSEKKYTLTNADLKRISLEKNKVKNTTLKKPILSDKDKAINHYNSAYKLYQVGEYNVARKSFLDFLHEYPKHTYADNALFWLAESYANENNCKHALGYYDRILAEYPHENKVPEALYKKTACLIKTSQEDEAKKSLLSLIKTYPKHPSTEKAKKKFLSKLVH